MDILLAHGYYLYEDPHELKVMKPYPTLGLLYLSSYLKSRGFSVGFFDATFSQPADFAARLERDRPAVVGLYCNLMTKRWILPMIQAAKAAGATVVLGGPEPPHYAEDYLARGTDVVVVGEGELTLEALLPHLARHGLNGLREIQGIIFRDGDGAIVRTPPRPYIQRLDDLPFPDRAAIPFQQYLDTWQVHHGHSSASLITARGCPYTCKWCSHTVFGHTHRRRSPANVVQEVEALVEAYRPDRLWYADDVLTIHPRWFFAYAALLKARGLRLPFECISRADRLNERLVDTLAEMGCYRLWIGSESGSQAVLDAMSRRTKVEEVQAMTHLLKRRGIQTGMFIMLGYEGEDTPQLEETVEHLKKADPDLFLTTVAYPIKGTPYYTEVESRVLSDKPWDDRTDRDLTVAGRHSRRFYSFATRWMVNEVAFHKLWHSSDKQPLRLAKTYVNSKLGRVGMALTAGETETGGQG
ncbi:MAG: B12-binding domain-containing radical SAM protein [Anaerolineae bacterium]|nr:B12-binding domain-containing radical SAM protein [Anaerolineae bacterium]